MYECESLAFARFLPNFLVPGPIAYCEQSDSFVTCSSAFELESYKYKVSLTIQLSMHTTTLTPLLTIQSINHTRGSLQPPETGRPQTSQRRAVTWLRKRSKQTGGSFLVKWQSTSKWGGSQVGCRTTKLTLSSSASTTSLSSPRRDRSLSKRG